MKTLFSLLLLVNLNLGFSQTNDSDVSQLNFKIRADSGDLDIISTIRLDFEPTSLSQNSSGLILDSVSAVTLNSGEIVDYGSFQVSDGNSVVFELTTSIEPDTTGFYGVEFQSLDWTTSPTTPGTSFTLDGFQTDVLSLQASTVPEPSTMALVTLGIVSLFFCRKRRS